MNKEELLKEIMKLPEIETNNPISTMTSINIDDLMSAIDRINKVPDYNDLLKENAELKKQLENCYCNRTDCSGRIKDSKVYDSLVQKVETQQKEFIKYLENMLDDENDIFSVVRVKDILQKYKEVIGGKKDESK